MQADESVRLIFKSVYIEWNDSSATEGWLPVSALTETKPHPIKSIGWLIRDDKDGLIITTSVGNDAVMDPLFIPHGAIIKKKILS